MKTETFKQAQKLQDHINYLETKIKSFDPKRKWVYLHVSDHYGNKADTIETYAFNSKYLEAAGYLFDNVVSDAYGIFLETVRRAMQERIDLLKSQFQKL